MNIVPGSTRFEDSDLREPLPQLVQKLLRLLAIEQFAHENAVRDQFDGRGRGRIERVKQTVYRAEQLN